MSYNSLGNLNILNLNIGIVDYQDLIDIVRLSILDKTKLLITGSNHHIINLALQDQELNNAIKSFNLIHPDGIGVFLASRILYGIEGFKNRITGSDFYTQLINYCLSNEHSLFFFGDEPTTLNQISINLPKLNIVGFHNGFQFDDKEIIKKINNSNADILIVGLGSGKQEKWISQYYKKINVNVIIAVGDGIKIFAGTKRRGPMLLRLIGLEWFVRLFFEPKRLWKRYIIGIPLFIFRVIKFKFSLKKSE